MVKGALLFLDWMEELKRVKVKYAWVGLGINYSTLTPSDVDFVYIHDVVTCDASKQSECPDSSYSLLSLTKSAL